MKVTDNALEVGGLGGEDIFPESLRPNLWWERGQRWEQKPWEHRDRGGLACARESLAWQGTRMKVREVLPAMIVEALGWAGEFGRSPKATRSQKISMLGAGRLPEVVRENCCWQGRAPFLCCQACARACSAAVWVHEWHSFKEQPRPSKIRREIYFEDIFLLKRLRCFSVLLSTTVKNWEIRIYNQIQRRGPSAGQQGLTFALLLGGGIQNLPSTVRRAQVIPHKPGFIPDVEIPADRTRDWRAYPRPHSRRMAKYHTSDLTVQYPATHQASLLCVRHCVRPWQALSCSNSQSTVKWVLILCPSHKGGNRLREIKQLVQAESKLWTQVYLTPKPKTLTMFPCLSED